MDIRANIRTVADSGLKKVQRLVNRTLNPDEITQVTLDPEGPVRGEVLLAHVVEAFTTSEGQSGHTHFGEARLMVECLNSLGFRVDVISYRNTTFHPSKQYDLLISSRVSFERLARLVGPDCIKVVHLDIAHWLFNNSAATQRCLDLQRRRNLTLRSYRLMEEVWSIEAADFALMLGNDFTFSTYAFSGKTIFQLPNPPVMEYEWQADKNFDEVRHNFLWKGSSGYAHKGLDLVLESFINLPTCHLTVCGNIESSDPKFFAGYKRELLDSPNITYAGWTDITSDEFNKICRRTIGMVYPSASEGCAGAVVTAMHAGLIPIVSYESGVDVDPSSGMVLDRCTINSITDAVEAIGAKTTAELATMSEQAWRTARESHSVDRYKEIFTQSIQVIVSGDTQQLDGKFVRYD